MLAAAGYANGLKDVDFLVRDSPSFKLWAVAIQAMLKETLNIETNMRTVQISVWFEEAQAGKFDITISAIVSTLHRPLRLLQCLVQQGWSAELLQMEQQRLRGPLSHRSTVNSTSQAQGPGTPGRRRSWNRTHRLLPVSWEKINDGWFNYVKGP